MKQMILILHLASGNCLEITDPVDVKNLKMNLDRTDCCSVHGVSFDWLGCMRNRAGEYSCTINGCVTHIHMHQVEYIEEHYREFMPGTSVFKQELIDVVPDEELGK